MPMSAVAAAAAPATRDAAAAAAAANVAAAAAPAPQCPLPSLLGPERPGQELRHMAFRKTWRWLLIGATRSARFL